MAARLPLRIDGGDAGGHKAVGRRILQIVAPGEVGGLESVVLALAAGQLHRGHSVTVAVVSEPRDGTHPFATALRKAGVPTEELLVPSNAYLKERRLIK